MITNKSKILFFSALGLELILTIVGHIFFDIDILPIVAIFFTTLIIHIGLNLYLYYLQSRKSEAYYKKIITVLFITSIIGLVMIMFISITPIIGVMFFTPFVAQGFIYYFSLHKDNK